jgi:hypothetical protein
MYARTLLVYSRYSVHLDDGRGPFLLKPSNLVAVEPETSAPRSDTDSGPQRQASKGAAAEAEAAAADARAAAQAAAADCARALGEPACVWGPTWVGGRRALEPHGAPLPLGEDPLPSEHFIMDPREPRLAFLGFVRPNVGAIPPMAELQAMWWALRLRRLVSDHHRTLPPKRERCLRRRVFDAFFCQLPRATR